MSAQEACMAGLAIRAAPSLSVIIPTSRGGSELQKCLRSLASQGYPDLEVIVVDNGSPGRCVARLCEQFPSVRMIRNEENRGFAAASNQGLVESRGELVLLLNDDTVLEPGALCALVRTLLAQAAWGACQAKLLLMDDPSRLDTAGSFLTMTGFLLHRGALEPEARFMASDEIFAAKGAALLLRREALDAVGGFDSDFFAYLEDTDLCWRLWLAGWRVGFAAEARVLHKAGATARALPASFVQFHSFKNRLCTLVKNLGVRMLFVVLPYHLGLCLGLAAWFALRGRPDLAWAILRAIAWNVRNLRQTLRKRREIQSKRRSSDRELMRFIMNPTRPRAFWIYAQRLLSKSSHAAIHGGSTGV